MQTESETIYKPENIPLFEAIYGKNLISLGGLDAIDNMFSDLSIKGLKALDIGFGLGGMAFYLAKMYQMEIAGVEIHHWMVEYAESHIPKDLHSLLKFTIYNQAGDIPFEAGSFDLVYSKGVLNHVHNKDNLFNQINTMLKIDGLFVIADWIHLNPVRDNLSHLTRETKDSYTESLKKAGFIDVKFRDDSLVFLQYIKNLLENIALKKEFIEKCYGKEIFLTILHEHQKLIDEINHKNKFATRIIAKKNSKNYL